MGVASRLPLPPVMLRLSKQVDYGIVLLSIFAAHAPEAVLSARDLAEETHLPLPTVGKILKGLTRGGLLTSHRGVHGGYSLGRAPEAISVTSIIQALEGPIAVVDCSPSVERGCEHELTCPMRTPIQRLNALMRDTLSRVTLDELNVAV